MNGAEGWQVSESVGFTLYFVVMAGVALAWGVFRYYRSNKPVDLSMLPEQFIVLDFETTGLKPEAHQIIEVGAIRVNRDSSEHESYQSLIKLQPGTRLSAKITEITGLTRDELEAKGESLADVLPELKEFIGDLSIVAYNADFDRGFLKAAARSHGIRFQNRWVCALEMAKLAWPNLKSHSLKAVSEVGGISTKGHHRALKDCQLALNVYCAAASILGAASKNQFYGQGTADTGKEAGAHYADCVDSVKQLKREGRHEEAITLLLEAVEDTEFEARQLGKGWGVAPWYYEQLAVIYRKEKRVEEEIQILERFAVQEHAPGATPPKLIERLAKLKKKHK